MSSNLWEPPTSIIFIISKMPDMPATHHISNILNNMDIMDASS